MIIEQKQNVRLTQNDNFSDTLACSRGVGQDQCVFTAVSADGLADRQNRVLIVFVNGNPILRKFG